MYRYAIEGSKKLSGTINVSGSKNASLPILAATILNSNESILYNVPEIEDIKITIEILKKLGCKVINQKNILKIDSSNINCTEIPKELMQKLRSSVIIVGALIAKFRNAIFSYPGGCNIGARPIDLHIKYFEKLGIDVKTDENIIYCSCENIKSTTIYLDFPSVGATENLILVSVLGNQEVIIENAALEPEIVDLANFLNKMGAQIFGAGTNKIKITGVKKLNSVEYRIIPDRIEVGTLLVAGAITEGKIELTDVIPEHVLAITSKLQETNCVIKFGTKSIYLEVKEKLKSTNINTMPYPGFPTDMQQIFSSLLSISNGISEVEENIFENRFSFVNELRKMGALIEIDKNKLIITGKENLNGTIVEGTDLRGTAALVIAGLNARGTTYVNNIEFLLRGYENLDKKLNLLGANVRVEEVR